MLAKEPLGADSPMPATLSGPNWITAPRFLADLPEEGIAELPSWRTSARLRRRSAARSHSTIADLADHAALC